MEQSIFFFTDLLRVDFFVGFGWYSILYFIAQWIFRQNAFLREFDSSAAQLMVYGGLLWLLLWSIALGIYFFGLEEGIEKQEFGARLTGNYAYGFWSQPLFWFLLTQLYRIRKIRDYLLPRMIISVFFVLSFERFLILITSIHRDFSLDNWTLGYNFTITPYWIVLGWISKILIVLVLVSFYHFGIKKILKFWS